MKHVAYFFSRFRPATIADVSIKHLLLLFSFATVTIFSHVAVTTAISFITLKDSSHAHSILSQNDSDAVPDVTYYETLERELANPTLFSIFRKLSSPDWAYGENSYLQEAYVVHDDRSDFEKKNFGIHMIFGAICLLTAFFQFWPYFRKRYRKIHRILGSMYIISAFGLGISVWIFLIKAGMETTYDGIVGNWGLYLLSGTEMVAVAMAIRGLLKKQYGLHLGWMAISLGSFLTAPFQRYIWFMIAYFNPEQPHKIANGAVDTSLFTIAYLAAYGVFVLNRHYSRDHAGRVAPSNNRLRSWMICVATAVGVLTMWFTYGPTHTFADSAAFSSMINLEYLKTEVAVVLSSGVGLASYSLLVSASMVMGAMWMLNKSIHVRLLCALALANIAMGVIEVLWGVRIGMPTEFLNTGGSHYLMWGTLHLLFGILLLVGLVKGLHGLTHEWVVMTWILSFLPVGTAILVHTAMPYLGVPTEYIEGGHSYVLLQGGSMQTLFLLAMLAAIYGRYTQQKIIS